MTEIFSIYDDKLAIEYEDRGHTYKLIDQGFGLDNLLRDCILPLPPNYDDHIPSATNIVDLLDKSNGLIPWAVNETINYIRRNILPGRSYDEVELSGILRSATNARFQKKDKAADIGTLVHDWISDHIHGRNPKRPVSNLLNGCIDAFLAWEKDNEVLWICSERKCYSHTLHYCGTLDGIAYVRGVPSLIDFKTSKNIYQSYRAQTAAYKQAIFEEITSAGSINSIGSGVFSDTIHQRIILHIKKDVGTTIPDISDDVSDTVSFIQDLNLFIGLRFAKWGKDGQ